MRHIYSLLLILCIPFIALGAVDLKKDLNPDVFKASGLERLTADELAKLNEAVTALVEKREEQVLVESEMPKGEDRFGFETIKSRVQEMFQSKGPERIESRIVGEFHGWKGHTKFVLENGQVWQQTDSERLVTKKMASPMVYIRRGALGSYLLKVEGYNSSVKVRRVK